MQCRYCGAVNDPKNKSCVLCGKTLDLPKPAREPDPEPETVQPAVSIQSPARSLTPEEHIRIGELIYAAYKHKEAGAIEDAIVACQGALALNDRSAPAHSLLGSLYESKGDIPSAIYQFEKVQALDTGNVANQQKLASLRQSPHPAADGAAAPAGRWKFPIKFDRIMPYVPIIVPAVVFIAVLGVLLMTIGKNRAAQDGTTFVPPKQNTPQTTSPVAPGAQMPSGTDPTRMAQPYLGPGQVAPADQGRNQTSKDGKQEQNTSQRTGPVQVPVPRSGVVTGTRTPTPLPPVNAQPAPRSVQPAPTPVITPIDEQPRPPTRTSAPTPAPKPKPAPQPAPQTADPEARAMQYQGSGKYQEAISSYRDALNRTSDSGRIYQQIAICQQRLGQRDQAVGSYKSAIRSYRDQLSAGRDASEVQRNIRSCEAGINVLTNQGN